MLPAWVVFIAIAIRFISGIGYLQSVLFGKARPNPITWFIWSLTAFVAFSAQVHAHVGASAYMTLAIAIGPLIICIAALIKHPSAPHFTFFSMLCGALALGGVVLWQITNNPLLAITCSIFADAFGGLPTIRKSYYHPHTEFALPYALSMLSMLLTLAALQSWQFSTYAFPLYIFCINLVIFSTIVWRTKVLKSKAGSSRGRQHRSSL